MLPDERQNILWIGYRLHVKDGRPTKVDDDEKNRWWMRYWHIGSIADASCIFQQDKALPHHPRHALELVSRETPESTAPDIEYCPPNSANLSPVIYTIGSDAGMSLPHVNAGRSSSAVYRKWWV